MNRPHVERWEESIQQTAHAFSYPPTPDIAGDVASRLAKQLDRSTVRLRQAWALVLAVVIMVGLLLASPVRAMIFEFLQIGSVRIQFGEPDPTPRPSPPAAGRVQSTPLHPVLGLAGETTLTEAERQAGFRIRLPTYPPDLGSPDTVFYQELGGPVVVLVWMDLQQPGKVRMSLHVLGENTFATKGNVSIVLTTTVGGREAAWTQGPYMLAYEHNVGQEFEMRQLVEGNVLVWFEDGLTYRLESDLSLEEAVHVAESLE